MRVLLLAGTGFVGSRVAEALGGHEVAALSRTPPGRAGSGLRHIPGDRDRLGEARGAIDAFGPDIVIDMTPGNEGSARACTEGLSGLTGRFVMISSASVYRAFGIMAGTEAGEAEMTPLCEDAPLRSALYPYRHSSALIVKDGFEWLKAYDKIEAERVFAAADTPATILRLPLIYGTGDPDRRAQYYLSKMQAGAPVIPLWRHAAAWRNGRAHVADIARAIALAAEKGEAGAVYHVAEPENRTEKEWVEALGAALGWDGQVVLVDNSDPAGAISVSELGPEVNFRQGLALDSTKIRRELGYAEDRPLAAFMAEEMA